VLVGWPGEWRQDLFEPTSEDRKAVLDVLGPGELSRAVASPMWLDNRYGWTPVSLGNGIMGV
jgi:hypothetical protein